MLRNIIKKSYLLNSNNSKFILNKYVTFSNQFTNKCVNQNHLLFKSNSLNISSSICGSTIQSFSFSTSVVDGSNVSNNSSIINNNIFGFENYIENEIKNKFNIVEPTEIQKKTIRPLLEGKDLFIVDETGTGKSFLLMSSVVNDFLKNNTTILREKEKIKQNRLNNFKLVNDSSDITNDSSIVSPSYIIVTPNRELAWQYGEWIRTMTLEMKDGITDAQKKPSVAMLVGGLSLQTMEQQLKEIQPDIIIGTPNLIYELLISERLSIDSLRKLIVDEADAIMQAMSRNSTYKEKQNRKKHLPEGVKLIIEINKRARSKMDIQPRYNTQQQYNQQQLQQKQQQQQQQQQQKPKITDRSILDALKNPKLRNNNKNLLSFEENNYDNSNNNNNEESKREYQQTVRWFQTIYASATLNLRNRKYIDEKDWINTDRVYVTLISKKKEDLCLPKQLVNQFVPVVSEQGILNAVVKKWKQLEPTKAIGVISNDGSVDRVVQALRARGINAKPLTEFMDFEMFNCNSIEDSEKRQQFQKQIKHEIHTKEKLVSREKKEKKEKQPTNQQANAPVILEEDEMEVERIEKMNKDQIIYIGKENSIRGVDISSVGHVFIINITLTLSSYLHMAGRTGRMGQHGCVVSIYNALLSRKYENVMKLLNAPFEEEL